MKSILFFVVLSHSSFVFFSISRKETHSTRHSNIFFMMYASSVGSTLLLFLSYLYPTGALRITCPFLIAVVIPRMTSFLRSIEYIVESQKCTDSKRVFVSGLYTPSVVCIFWMSHCVRAKQILPPSTIFRARRLSFQQIIVSAFDFSIICMSFANPGRPGLFALMDSWITSTTSSHSIFAISRQKSS